MESVCVFCGSSKGTRETYAAAARALGRELAARRIRLIYGGGRVGLMGVLADAVLDAGGEVIGVIPRALLDRELAHTGIDELRVTATMHERKALMSELADGFIALPGGFGTLEEFVEVLTWSQLGFQRKPCGLLDAGGFFGSLLAFFDHLAGEGFVRPGQRELVLTGTDPGDLLDALAAWRPPYAGGMTDPDITFTTLERASGERFQALRRELGVSSFGLNLIVLEPGQRGRIHAHQQQEEVYLVLAGELTLVIEGVDHMLGIDRAVRVGPPVRRQLANAGPERLVLLALGGSGDHVGRDASAWTSWEDDGEGRTPQELPLPGDLPTR